jgi:hypothetical protein
LIKYHFCPCSNLIQNVAEESSEEKVQDEFEDDFPQAQEMMYSDEVYSEIEDFMPSSVSPPTCITDDWDALDQGLPALNYNYNHS